MCGGRLITPSTSGRTRRGSLVASVALLLVVVAGCGSDPGPTSPGDATSDGGPSAGSSPFTVDDPPDRFAVATAGTGTAEPIWGQDCCGSDEPYTVLSPDGAADGDDVVVVALTGYAAYQGGIDQAVTYYPPGGSVESFSHGGGDARYVPPGTEGDAPRWAEVVVAQTEDLAIRVTSPQGGREELLGVLDRVEVPTGHDDAPTIDATDLEVVGTVDTDGLLALQAGVRPDSGEVPGPGSAHSIGWTGAEQGGPQTDGEAIYDDQLTVSTLPGEALDLAALAVGGWAHPSRVIEVHDVEAGGRPAMVLDDAPDELGYQERTVVLESGWGDVVVARSAGTSPATEEELLTLAASVEPADQATWDELVIEATGGPGLHPDEGRMELARGEAGGLEWLLQDGLPSDGLTAETVPIGGAETGVPTEAGAQVDTCLKLSNRSRSCTTGGGGSVEEAVWFADRDQYLPDFVIVVTRTAARRVEVTTSSDEAEAELVTVPDSDLRTAVVFVDGPGSAICGDVPGMTVPESMKPMRVEALDTDGNVLGCLGLGGR